MSSIRRQNVSHGGETADIALDHLRLTCSVLAGLADGAINLPVLKGVALVAKELVDVAQTVRSNRTDCYDLAQMTCEYMVAIIRALKDKSIDDVDEQLIDDIHDLGRELEAVRDLLYRLLSRSMAKRILHYQSDLRRIVECKQKLDHSFRKFELAGMINLRLNVAEIKRGGAAQDIPARFDVSWNVTALPGSGLLGVSSTPPPAPPPLVGRRDLIRGIVAHLEAPGSARIAIIGPGGMGKTSVALTVLHHEAIETKFQNKRFFIPCEAASSAEFLVNAILKVIPGSNRIDDPLTEMHERLQEAGSIFLVLDNFETPYLADTASGAETALSILCRISAIKNVSLVITMRCDSPPALDQIGWTKAYSLDPLSLEESKAAFLAIAQGLLPEELVELDILLRKLDGLPLAVTLLARTKKSQSCKVLLERWNNESTALLHDPSAPSGRLTSLDASILFSLRSAPVISRLETTQLLTLISHLPDGVLDWETNLPLIAPGFVSVFREAEALFSTSLAFIQNGTMKVLAPIREHVLHYKKIDHKHLAAMRQYFYELVNRYAHAVRGDVEFPLAVDKLFVQAGNITSILEQSFLDEGITDDNYAAAYYFSCFMAWVSPFRGLLESMLPTLKQRHWKERHSQCVMQLGHIHRVQHHYETAKKLLEEAKLAYKSRRYIPDRAECFWGLASILRVQGYREEACRQLAEARKLYAKIKARASVVDCDLDLGIIYAEGGRHAEGRKVLEENLPLVRQHGDLQGEAKCTWGLGFISMNEGRYENAISMLQLSAKVYVEAGEADLGPAYCDRILAEVDIREGRLEKAWATLKYVEVQMKEGGDRRGVILCMCTMAVVLYKRGDRTGGTQQMDNALRMFKEMEMGPYATQWRDRWNRVVSGKELGSHLGL